MENSPENKYHKTRYIPDTLTIEDFLAYELYWLEYGRDKGAEALLTYVKHREPFAIEMMKDVRKERNQNEDFLLGQSSFSFNYDEDNPAVFSSLIIMVGEEIESICYMLGLFETFSDPTIILALTKRQHTAFFDGFIKDNHDMITLDYYVAPKELIDLAMKKTNGGDKINIVLLPSTKNAFPTLFNQYYDYFRTFLPHHDFGGRSIYIYSPKDRLAGNLVKDISISGPDGVLTYTRYSLPYLMIHRAAELSSCLTRGHTHYLFLTGSNFYSIPLFCFFVAANIPLDGRLNVFVEEKYKVFYLMKAKFLKPLIDQGKLSIEGVNLDDCQVHIKKEERVIFVVYGLDAEETEDDIAKAELLLSAIGSIFFP